MNVSEILKQLWVIVLLLRKNLFTKTPANIEANVFRWLSGENQKHDVKLSQMLMFLLPVIYYHPKN